MEDLDRPSFSPEVCESIEREQYRVHKLYWDILERLGVSIHLRSIPRPPKQPLYLHRTLGAYACELFDIEAARYPNDRRLPQWLDALAGRIETLVLEKLAELAMSSGLLMSTLEYHLTRNEMLTAIRAALAKHIKTYPTQSTAASSKVAVINAREQIPQTNDSSRTRDSLKPKRFTGVITSVSAARRMENYIQSKGIEMTEFAIRAGTTDRTLRSFRRTGRVRRRIFDGIAEAMQLTREDLLKE